MSVECSNKHYEWVLCAECLNKHFEVEYGVGLSDKHYEVEIEVRVRQTLWGVHLSRADIIYIRSITSSMIR